MKKLLCSVSLIALLTQVTACGTILYPERKGQRSGRIDVGVAVLDGIGLLFFFVPGIIAYAVDFATGTIYLPGGKRASLEDGLNKDNMVAIHLGKENMSKEAIEQAIYARTGQQVHVCDAEVYSMNADGKKVKVVNPLS